MTLQEWLAENRYADSLPRRSAALILKAGIEIAFFSFFALLGALWADLAFDPSSFSLTPLSNEVLVYWGSFTVALTRFGWCFTTDTQ